jgi:hypothetical protein
VKENIFAALLGLDESKTSVVQPSRNGTLQCCLSTPN